MALKKQETSIAEMAGQIRTLSGEMQISTYKVPDNITDKDKRIVRQGIVQAVLQSPALIAYCSDLPAYEQTVKDLANKFVNWVWERSV